MASVEVASLLDYLQKLAIQYPDQIHDEEEFRKLVNTFEGLKGLLEAGSRKQKADRPDPIFDKLELQSKEVVHELEDTIDSRIITLSTRSKIMNFARRSLTVKREFFGVDLKSFGKDKLEQSFFNFEFDFKRVGFEDISAGTSMEAQAWERPIKGNFVGLDDELEILLEEVSKETEKLEVVAITGMPGIGKTTMAWRIFSNSNVQYEFPTRIWVHVSQEFNWRDVLFTILKCFTPVNDSILNKSDSEIEKTLSGYLGMGKFLIVMDDVWTTEVWNDIKHVFKWAGGRSKVIITSRSDEVASQASRKRTLRVLTPKESWHLMQLAVFGKIDSYPRELEKVGKLIAESCKGLPVGIIVVSGILATQETMVHWEEVYDRVNTSTLGNDLHRVISMSYVTLPPDLKLCFLYLGMLPKDSEFPIWKLTWLWISEGFITKHEGRKLEDTARDYLKELIGRNLLMKGRISITGEMITCRVHNMVRDFCQNEAATEKQNLYKEIRSDPKTFEPSIASLDHFRRLCIHTNVRDFFLQKPKAEKARSFLCFSSIPIIFENNDISCLGDAFSLVRVLDATSLKFTKFPPNLTRLVHLRYLILSGEFKTLPKDISRLWRLEILVLNTSSRKLEVLGNIWTMMHLRHLKTKASLILHKGKGEGGQNLHTLGRISPEVLTEGVLTKMENLEKLGIRGMLSDAMSLEKLGSLRKMTLVHDVYPDHASERPMRGLPRPYNFPPRLTTLVLINTYLGWEHMPQIGQIDTLNVLKLKENAFVGESWEVADEGFRHLEALSIDDSELRYWTASRSSFRVLRRLELKHCKYLQEVPPELGESLEMLYMESVTRYAISSAKEIEWLRGKTQIRLGRASDRDSGFKLIIASEDQIAY